MKGKTSTGFEFDIEDERLDDMELVDIMAEIDENPLLMPKLCKMLLGEEQKKDCTTIFEAKMAEYRLKLQQMQFRRSSTLRVT